MDGTTLLMFSIFLISQIALIGFCGYNVYLKSKSLESSNRISRAFESMIAQQEINRKVQTLFNKRLNRHRLLLIALYEALEGAAKGVSEEETLQKLEKFSAVIKAHSKNNPEIDIS